MQASATGFVDRLATLSQREIDYPGSEKMAWCVIKTVIKHRRIILITGTSEDVWGIASLQKTTGSAFKFPAINIANNLKKCGITYGDKTDVQEDRRRTGVLGAANQIGHNPVIRRIGATLPAALSRRIRFSGPGQRGE